MTKVMLGGAVTALKYNVNNPAAEEFRKIGEILKKAGERKRFANAEMFRLLGTLTGR